MRLSDRLASAKLAAVLMAAAGACTLVSFLIPQRSVVGEEVYLSWRADVGAGLAGVVEWVGLERIFSSRPFLAIMALLAVNLVMCMLKRSARRLRATTLHVRLPESAVTVPVGVGEPQKTLAHSLSGWSVHRTGDDQWSYRSGEWGWWGSLAMHVGLLLLLLAGALSSMTRFSGTLVLTEGQQVLDERDAYVEINDSPRFGSVFTGAQFGLESMEFTYDGDTVVDVLARMIRSGDAGLVTARVNYPFRVQGKSYLLSETGLAAGLRLERDGQVFADGIVNLGRRIPEGFTDTLTMPGGQVLTVTAVPVRSVEAGTVASRVFLLTDPVVRISAGESQPLELAPGESGEVGGVRAAVTSVRRWTSFNVRSDKGLPVAYFAFFVILAGVLVRWLDPEVRLIVELSEDESQARLWYSTRYGAQRATRALERVSMLLSGGEH